MFTDGLSKDVHYGMMMYGTTRSSAACLTSVLLMRDATYLTGQRTYGVCDYGL